jgi:hypothetical protein
MRHLFQFATAGKRNWTMNGAGAGLKLALWIVLSARSQAATWYVDSAATGAHNGTSWSNAWTSFSQISGVSAGDTVNISGGTSGSSETYSIGGSFPFVNGVNNSITTVNQIGQDSAHDGTAILNLGGNDIIGGSIYNITLSGNANSDGLRHFACTNYGSIANQWSNGSVSNAQITYCTFSGSSAGVFTFHNLDNLEFDHNFIYKTPYTADSSLFNGVFSYQNAISRSFGWNKVHHNEIHLPRAAANSDMGDDCFSSMVAIDYYNNTIISYYTNTYPGDSTAQHQDGVQSQWSDHCRIYNNIFDNLENSDIFPEGIGTYSHRYLQIFNNIMMCDSSSLAGSPMRGIDGVGNTGSGSIFTNVVVANNLLVNLGTSTSGAAYGIRLQGYPSSSFANGNYTGTICANNIIVDAYCGYALNPEVTSVGNFSDTDGTVNATNFVSYTAFAGTNNNFNLTANSMFRNAGTNLTAFGITTDIAGDPRPATGNWDVGPYQYTSGGGSNGSNLLLSVSRGSYDFGSSSTNLSITNRFLFALSNPGSSRIIGTSSVAAPFSIVFGNTYSLSQSQTQLVSVCFSPSVISNYTRTVTFSVAGGAGTNVTVTGRGSAPSQVPSPQMLSVKPSP